MRQRMHILIHEMKLIVDLIYESGFAGMRYSILILMNTVITLYSKIITEDTKNAMRGVLKDIQEGVFARNWLLENQIDVQTLKLRERMKPEHPVEKVGKELRKMFTWNEEDKLINN